MKTRTIRLTGLAALVAGLCLSTSANLALAQGGPGGGGPMDPAAMIQMRVDRMNELLKLSKAQQKQATTIFTNAMETNQSVQGGMREANQSLAAAIKSDDESAMAQAANTMGTLTAQMQLNNAKAEAAFYKTLTPEQQAKYQPGAGGMRGGMGMGMGGGQGGRRGGPPQE